MDSLFRQISKQIEFFQTNIVFSTNIIKVLARLVDFVWEVRLDVLNKTIIFSV